MHGVISAVPTTGDPMGKHRPITLTGIVIAAAWEQNGAVKAVDFAGYDEKRYRVANDPTGKRLRRRVQERLVVEGVIENTAGQAIIHVKRFHRDHATPVDDPVQPNR